MKGYYIFLVKPINPAKNREKGKRKKEKGLNTEERHRKIIRDEALWISTLKEPPPAWLRSHSKQFPSNFRRLSVQVIPRQNASISLPFPFPLCLRRWWWEVHVRRAVPLPSQSSAQACHLPLRPLELRPHRTPGPEVRTP